MGAFTLSAAHAAARLQATADFANAGSGDGTITFYSANNTALVTVVLADPACTISNGVLSVHQASSSGDMVLVEGVATTATWRNGDDVVVATGAVTDETGTGPFILRGSSGTLIYAGGRAVIGVTEIT